MIPVGSISDTEAIIKASLSLIHHDRAAAFKLSDRSPLPPAVIARLHVTCPGPGNTRIIYCLLARSVRSPAIILPLYNSKILTSTCATVSTDIASYEARHGRMPLHYDCTYIFRYVSHAGFHELPLPDSSRHAIYTQYVIQIREH
jgi:hypothetical protein